MLIEGESLLNDGTAMVFYLLFMGIVKSDEGSGEKQSFLEIVIGFIRSAFGGPLLGVVSGVVGCFWLRRYGADIPLASRFLLLVSRFSLLASHFSLLASHFLLLTDRPWSPSSRTALRSRSAIWSFLCSGGEELDTPRR